MAKPTDGTSKPTLKSFTPAFWLLELNNVFNIDFDAQSCQKVRVFQYFTTQNEVLKPENYYDSVN